MLLCGERKRGTELRNKEEQDKDHNCNAEDIRNHKMNMNVSKTDWELVRGFYSPIMKGEIRQAIQWKLFLLARLWPLSSAPSLFWACSETSGDIRCKVAPRSSLIWRQQRSQLRLRDLTLHSATSCMAFAAPVSLVGLCCMWSL